MSTSTACLIVYPAAARLSAVCPRCNHTVGDHPASLEVLILAAPEMRISEFSVDTRPTAREMS